MRLSAVLMFFLLLILPGFTVQAQIINTIRGWSDIDEGWSVEVEGKFSLTRGNYHHMDLSSHGAVQFLTGGNRFRFLITEKFYIIDGNTVSENFMVHLRHNYRLSDTFSTLLFTQNQHQPYKLLQRRTLLGGGIRMDFLRSSNCCAALGVSAMMESVSFTDDTDEDDKTIARGSFFVSFIWMPVDVLTVDLSGFYQPLLPDFQEPLMTATLSMEAHVTRNLSMTTAFDLTYDDSPVEGIEKTDYELKSGLRFNL